MNLLISAYACEPGRGSEPGVGWNIVKALSSNAELWVITRANNRTVIESSGEPWIDYVHWIFWDPPAWLTFWKKRGRGVQLFYILWQIGVYYVARKLVKEHSFDLCHHVTFGKYWIPSRLASLPVPFVFGPVGGGEETPLGLRAASSLGARISEGIKSLTSYIYPRLPWNRKLYRSAAWTFAATAQTAEKLRRLGVQKMSLLPQSGISEDELPVFASKSRTPGSPLTLVTACRLIHWKAVDLAIEAVALAAREIDVRLIVLQTGPEEGRLKALVSQLGIDDLVEFRGRLPTLNDVFRTIAEADALVHPALHEAFGQACLESLALGTPVICLNWGGPGLIVDDSCGFTVEPGGREETVKRLADAMLCQSLESKTGASRANTCKGRAFGNFHWYIISDQIVNNYAKIIN
jgi:glycosyltransferase involved in cell wall biosynthesis